MEKISKAHNMVNAFPKFHSNKRQDWFSNQIFFYAELPPEAPTLVTGMVVFTHVE